MARLFAREDWRLAAAAILGGILAGLLVLLLWARATGGLASAPPVRPDLMTGAAAPRPLAGALARDVLDRLGKRPVPSRPLRGTLSLRARNVVWREPGTGRPFLRARAVSGTIDAAAANRLDIVLGPVLLERPELVLISDGRHWNYERPLAGLLAEDRDRGGRQVTFRLAALRVVDGSAHVDMPARDFTIEGIEGSLADLWLAAPGLPAPRLDVASVTGLLRVAGQERAWALSGERGRLTFPDATTQFDFEAVTIAGTRLEQVRGVWDPGAPGYGLTAAGEARGVDLARLEFLAPERLPREGTARFAFEVEPLPGDGTGIRVTELELVSGRSRASGSVAAEVFGNRVSVERVALRLNDVAVSLLEPITGALPYRGTVTGSIEGPGSAMRMALSANLTAEGAPERFGTRVSGVVSLTRSGLSLNELRAELQQLPLGSLRALVPGLPLAGTATGTITLSGSPATTPLQLSLRLEVGNGLATVTGSVDLTGAVPRYDITGRLVGVSLGTVLALKAPPVALTARLTLAGSGFRPATASARFQLDGGFAGWRAAAGDTVALVAALASGSLQVGALSVRLAGAELAGDGNWRFLEPVSGAVRYRIAVSELAPFGPYLPVVGDSVAAGTLRAEGTVSGALERVRLAGTLAGTGVRSGGWGAGRAEAVHDVVLSDSLPALDVRFEGDDIVTPSAGSYRTLAGTVRLAAPQLQLDVQGTQVGGGGVALVAEGSWPRSGARSVLLQRAFFDLPEGRWELQAPARISWGGEDGVRVTGLRLQNAASAGLVSLDGRVLPVARLDARVVTANLPVDQVQELVGREPRVSGRLWADVAVRPPGSPSEIQGSFRLEEAVIQGVALSRLEGTLDYAAGAARTEFAAAFDSASGRLQVRGTLPLRIALADSFQVGITPGGALAATVTAERVSLRPLGLLVPRVRNLEGQIDGTMSLQGTAAAPSLSGQVSLRGGRMTVPELNQRFDSIGGSVTFVGRTAQIRDLRVRRAGWARVNGTMVFEELDRPVLDLVADLDGFQPMGVDEHPDAAFDGRVTVNGELDGLVVGGRVVIHDGYLAVPQLGAGFNPAYLDEIDPTPVLGRELAAPERSGWAARARIEDLRATFGEGAWVDAFDATLQLRGALTINRSGDDLRLTGTLEGERGTYTLAAGPIVRRFEITRAQVRFLGEPEPNPGIDITARRVVLDPDGRRMEVEVRITGTARTPRLALASADAPNIPESELLSFLLFGRRTLALGENVATTGERVFEQTIFGGVAEVAGLELERALSANLGLQLDLFQLRFGQGFGGLTTPTFVVGRQISNDFFLTVESGLNALFGDAGGAANNWAVRLEWAIDPRQALELGSEPLNRSRLLRGIGAALPPGRPSPQQLYAEYRRRWVY